MTNYYVGERKHLLLMRNTLSELYAVYVDPLNTPIYKIQFLILNRKQVKHFISRCILNILLQRALDFSIVRTFIKDYCHITSQIVHQLVCPVLLFCNNLKMRADMKTQKAKKNKTLQILQIVGIIFLWSILYTELYIFYKKKHGLISKWTKHVFYWIQCL